LLANGVGIMHCELHAKKKKMVVSLDIFLQYRQITCITSTTQLYIKKLCYGVVLCHLYKLERGAIPNVMAAR